MKNKIIGILVCTLLILASSVTIAMGNEKKGLSTKLYNYMRSSIDHTLYINYSYVVEIDCDGVKHWEYQIDDVVDVERLEDGNTLIVAGGSSPDGRVFEIDNYGNVVWEKIIDWPVDAERLNSGNTLVVADSIVYELNIAGSVVWLSPILSNLVLDAERGDDGNTFIADTNSHRVIEMTPNQQIIWECDFLYFPVDVEILNNGNILITGIDGITYKYRVIETNGIDIFWLYELEQYQQTYDAERLDNGNTLIAEFAVPPPKGEAGQKNSVHRIFEVNDLGALVWEYYIPGDGECVDVERIPNLPPYAPIINGTREGNVGTSYTYQFSALDPDYDDIKKIVVKWGDGNEQTINGPFDSEEVMTASHTWSKKGTYIIKATAEDVDELVSPEATFEITMPRNKTIFTKQPILFLLLKRFPIIRNLLEL